MSEPLFLTIDEVLEIHAQQLADHGGTLGVRDGGLLASALAMPEQSFGGAYVHVNLCEMAAAYLFHLVQNHPFVDGNKRVGTAAALIFLLMNGIRVSADIDAFERLVIEVASGKVGKAAVAIFLEKHAHPR